MKTANELAQEYFAKTPMERLHTTLQDYVFDYQQGIINNMKKQIQKAFIAIDDGEYSNASRRLKRIYKDEQQKKSTD